MVGRQSFLHTAVADKQRTGLQNPQMWGQYPPAVPFFIKVVQGFGPHITVCSKEPLCFSKAATS
ncbi:MAG: hypothetical protein CJBNEKGG_01007 [Prosthecobacter sp.]|nr:hypothetical protein [Prosthecobacter sp.]